MINISIDKPYRLPEDWHEMSDTMAAQIFEIEMPKSLKEFYDHKFLQKDEPNLDIKDWNKVFPAYYGRVLVAMGIPEDIAPKIMARDRIWFYNQYCLKFVVGLHYWPDYTPKKPEFITHEGEKLYFPKSKEVFGDEIPMAYASAFEWSEAMDLEMAAEHFKGGKYEIGRNIASILLRPKGEAYDEDTSLERAKTMKLNMDTVWEVFFCLIELINTQKQHDNLYLEAQVKKARGIRRYFKQAERWKGLLPLRQ